MKARPHQNVSPLKKASEKALAFFLFAALMLTTGAACREPYPDLKLEKAWAKEIYAKYKKKLPCRKSVHEKYLNTLARDLLRHVKQNPYEIRVCISRRESLNAFALPAGYIFIHRGLLRGVKNESELAFVMGHEISHVLLRHAFRREKKRKVGEKFIKRIKKTPLVLPVYFFGAMGILKYSRFSEKNADLKAMDLIGRSGFDPRAALNFMDLIRQKQFSRRGLMGQIFSTHPGPLKRKRYLKRRINRMRAKDEYRKDSAGFKRLKKHYTVQKKIVSEKRKE